MTLDEVRKKYLDFFEKKHKHAVISSSSLVPEDDPTTLFISSGMQPLLPYFLGKKHTKGKRLTNSQRCFRAEDIEEVGDNRHTTFFEMLGNFSFGDYFKSEQLPWLYEFLTDEIGLDSNKLYITVFEGDEKAGIPKDTESFDIWKKLLGSDDRISYYGAKENWWSRSGLPENMPVGEPGGPDSEVFYDFGTEHDKSFGENCHPNCECGRFVEIGNSVFMEYIKQEDGSFEHLPSKNVDFGGGLERITAASNDDSDIFNIDALRVIVDEIKNKYGWDYASVDIRQKKSIRIVVDHLRAAVSMVADGVIPSNKMHGYILRRLLRRAIFKAYSFAPGFSNLYPIVDLIINQYKNTYNNLNDNRETIHNVIEQEEHKFMKTLEKGKKIMDKMIRIGKFERIPEGGKIPIFNRVNAKITFDIYQNYGYPIELIQEELGRRGLVIDMDEFNAEVKKNIEKHQELSRAGSLARFKGGLADHSVESTKYHTATHLLLQALKDVLGNSVVQKGSNITAERLRFDFSWGEKLTDEERQKVEDIVNQKIKEALDVTSEETDGRIIYTIGDYSTEPCGGPHVKNTNELGIFRIKKQESVSAGVRRIKAILE